MAEFSIPQIPAELNREINVSDGQTAKLLLDTRNRAVLAFFTKKENTVSALAEHLNVTVANAYYYVRLLSSANIIEISSQEKRAGKSLKYYRCSADSYFIPSQVAPSHSLREFIAASDAALRDMLERSIEEHVYERQGWGLRFFRDDIGNIHMAFTPQAGWQDWSWLEHNFLPDQAAIFSVTVPLSLKREQAKELQAELGQLFQKYYISPLAKEDSQVNEPSYVMRLELAPVPKK